MRRALELRAPINLGLAAAIGAVGPKGRSERERLWRDRRAAPGGGWLFDCMLPYATSGFRTPLSSSRRLALLMWGVPSRSASDTAAPSFEALPRQASSRTWRAAHPRNPCARAPTWLRFRDWGCPAS